MSETPTTPTPNSKPLIFVLALILIFIAAGVGYLVYGRPNSLRSLQGGVSITNIEGLPEGTTVEIVDRVNADLFDKTPRPSLSRTLPAGNVSADVYTILVQKRKETVALIESNLASMTQWINLGILHKQVGDYEGARIYWNYVVTVNPENIAAHWNLATLYGNYLKDTAKAESEFKKVIALDTHYTAAYTELSVMYQSIGNSDKALAILLGGLAHNPGNLDLLIAKAHLYRDMGKKVEAAGAYDAAIAQAKKENNTSLAATLTAEKNAL